MCVPRNDSRYASLWLITVFWCLPTHTCINRQLEDFNSNCFHPSILCVLSRDHNLPLHPNSPSLCRNYIYLSGACHRAIRGSELQSALQKGRGRMPGNSRNLRISVSLSSSAAICNNKIVRLLFQTDMEGNVYGQPWKRRHSESGQHSR